MLLSIISLWLTWINGSFQQSYLPPKKKTPESIINFLDKESCYFVSAGFKDSHYVLDYFRWFRDHVLLKFSLGKRLLRRTMRQHHTTLLIIYIPVKL